MTKHEIVSKVAERTGLTKSSAEKVVNAFIDILTEGIKNKERIAIPGFGVFKVIQRKERRARNPKTGAEIKIPAKISPVWRPSKELKDLK